MSRPGESRREDRVSEFNSCGWVFYSYRAFARRQFKIPYGRELYDFKLRINLMAEDYARHKDAIIQYLLAEGDYQRFVAEGLDTVYCFKVPTVSQQEIWAEDGRFNDNAQFTLYLSQPNDPVKIQQFMGRLQHFLSDLGVRPAMPARTDVGVQALPNISARLERIRGEYIDSIRLTDDPYYVTAYHYLMRDTWGYASLVEGKGREAFREEENDTIHQLMHFGFLAVSEGDEIIGVAYQRIAIKLRVVFDRLADMKFDEVWSCLADEEWNFLAESEMGRYVCQDIFGRLSRPVRAAWMLTRYIEGRLSEGCLETGRSRDTNSFFAKMKSSCHAENKLGAARKIFRYLNASNSGRELVLKPEEQAACLRKRDRLWLCVIKPYGLEELVAGAKLSDESTKPPLVRVSK